MAQRASPIFLKGYASPLCTSFPRCWSANRIARNARQHPLPLHASRDWPCRTVWRIDGTDVVAVYTAMRDAMEHAREGHGPVLLEMMVTRPPEPDAAHEPAPAHNANHPASQIDPLLRCQQILQEQGAWSDEWAEKLYRRISAEVEQAMQDALRDTL